MQLSLQKSHLSRKCFARVWKMKLAEKLDYDSVAGVASVSYIKVPIAARAKHS
jgi:hypothetical protein